MIDPLVPLILALSLALLFFMAANHKLKHFAHFQASLGAYEIVPQPLLPVVARTLPWLEMALVFLLLIPASRALAGAVAAALLVVYGLAMAVNLKRGRSEIDCGCGDAPQTLSGWLLLRNALLACGAVIVALPVLDRSLAGLDLLLVVLFTAVLALFYLTVDELVRNHAAILK
ncbi:MAG: hypothetical protein RLZZ385_2728 [Pseudomonadota bacterium]|jgi:uncharacterized membrane protein YphA (DoxX/SURF4 family)